MPDNRLPTVKLNGLTYVKRSLAAQIAPGDKLPVLWVCVETGNVAFANTSLAAEVQGAWEDENL